MKPLLRTLLLTAAAALCLAAPAQADFGFSHLDLTFNGADGSTQSKAGSHPFSMNNTIDFNTATVPGFGEAPDGAPKDLKIDLPPGLAGVPKAVPACAAAEFIRTPEGGPSCAASTALGVATLKVAIGVEAPATYHVALYNLVPPPGVASKLGFAVLNEPVTIEVGLKPEPPYNIEATLHNIPQPVRVYGSAVDVWGNPASPEHDAERGRCVTSAAEDKCPTTVEETPFLTLPTHCGEALPTIFAADSWQEPEHTVSEEIFTHDGSEPPAPLGMTGCLTLPFEPAIHAQPTSKAAQSPSGLDFSLDVEDEGISSSDGIAESDIRKAEVTLPEGFSTNPSLAEGLNVCTEDDLARETAFSDAGAGCPNASKVGTVEVLSPLVDESIDGSLYVAKPYENPFHSLLALYIVVKNPTLGVIVKQPLEVKPDPVTGRLTTVAEELPQLPFSHFRLHFREGTRSPLATPPLCGTYNAEATLTPWSGAPPFTTTSAFQIVSGPNNGPCPTGGTPPFHPGLAAGTLNNAAGHFSPFNLRLSRQDGEQEITHFSIKLPPGIVGKLAGIPYCSEAQIAQAKARTGPHGGQEEIDSPSCPAASQIGRTLAGSGVGPSLAYAPGKVYLAGPYHGSNLSMVAITAAKVGPFDLGTVVVREAFKIDPETAEVFVDSTGSDPIPHIIEGIPVHLRDIRAYVDRPEFVLNPTDCTRTSTASTLLGSGLDFGSEADDRPVTVSTPFQAADCAALPFKPRLALKLQGGTRRGDYPAFKATLNMNGIGEAGIQQAQVTLPKSEFIANAHFNTICTRVQFKAGAGNGAECPAGSIYGKARATTPILGEPLTGPVFLRSSEHQLPDLVVALHNAQIDFVLDGHVDSVKGKLRNTFEAAPDAPVSSFVLEMQGGKKGLFENSTNLCAATHKAIASFTGQNGKRHEFNPVVKAKCPKARGKKRSGRRSRR